MVVGGKFYLSPQTAPTVLAEKVRVVDTRVCIAIRV